MKLREMSAAFEKYDDEASQFENVNKKLSQRPDMNGFMLIESILPRAMFGEGMIEDTGHDGKIWLGINVHSLARVITEEIVHDLVCSGIFFDKQEEALYIIAG